MASEIILFGSAAAVIHFILIGALYMNPIVSRMYSDAEKTNPALRVWPNKKHYMILMFGGSLIESWLLTFGYLLFRTALPRSASWGTALICAIILGMIRVYPRGFDKWIQTNYPPRLIAVEAFNGMIGTTIIIFSVKLLSSI